MSAENDLYAIIVTPKNARLSGSKSIQHLTYANWAGWIWQRDRQTEEFQRAVQLPQAQSLGASLRCASTHSVWSSWFKCVLSVQHEASKHKCPALSNAQSNMQYCSKSRGNTGNVWWLPRRAFQNGLLKIYIFASGVQFGNPPPWGAPCKSLLILLWIRCVQECTVVQACTGVCALEPLHKGGSVPWAGTEAAPPPHRCRRSVCEDRAAGEPERPPVFSGH